jgi:8-oxo-dGTP diphosphatase
MEKEEKKYCYRYPHPAVTTDCVIFGFDSTNLKVLLVKRGVEPYSGCWALPGGFLKEDETIEECAARELLEETNLKTELLQQFGVFSKPDRDPRERVMTVAFLALVKYVPTIKGGDDAKEARWFDLDAMPELAFDHKDIFRAAILQLQRIIHFEPIGFELLDSKFTMPQLQKLYEAILGVTFDRRNFQRKMLGIGILKPLKEKAARGPHRTASLFSFDKEKYDLLKSNGNFRIEF